jgi:ornithine cyclodeaminase/alanine dehydrogenase-like protein (mu-crystallin family)
VATYGEIVRGLKPGRASAEERILTDLFGLGVWDAAVLHWAYRWAIEHQAGTEFHLS